MSVGSELHAAGVALILDRVDPSYDIEALVTTETTIFGVRVPELRSVAKSLAQANPDLKADDALAMMDLCAAAGSREEMLLGLFLLERFKKALAPTHWPRLLVWLKEVDNWETSDQMAKLGGEWVCLEPRLLTELEQLASSTQQWEQRFAVAATTVLNHAGRSNPEATFKVLSLAMGSSSAVVHKALSWALREVSKTAPQATFEFMLENRQITPPKVQRDGSRKLTPEMKAALFS